MSPSIQIVDLPMNAFQHDCLSLTDIVFHDFVANDLVNLLCLHKTVIVYCSAYNLWSTLPFQNGRKHLTAANQLSV